LTNNITSLLATQTSALSPVLNIVENAIGATASVTAVPNSTYEWTISGGTITSATNAQSITFNAAGSGSITIACNLSVGGTLAGVGSLDLAIVPVGTTPLATSFQVVVIPVSAAWGSFLQQQPVPSAYLNTLSASVVSLDSFKHNRTGDETHTGIFEVTAVPRATQGSIDVLRYADIGVSGYVPTLDTTGHIPLAQLPPSVAGALSFMGTYDAATNKTSSAEYPTIPASVAGAAGNQGWYFLVNVAGSSEHVPLDPAIYGTTPFTLNVGDTLVSNGTYWDKIDGNTNEITSVAGVTPDSTGKVTLHVGDIIGAAPLESPALTGVPTAPTPVLGDSSTTLATTAFVSAQIAVSAPVQSVAGRIGAVTLTIADIPDGAPINSPAFTGVPTGPSAPAGTTSDQLATCYFVTTSCAAVVIPVTSVFGRVGAVTLQSSDITAALGFIPYSSANPNGYITNTGNAATATKLLDSNSKPTSFNWTGVNGRPQWCWGTVTEGTTQLYDPNYFHSSGLYLQDVSSGSWYILQMSGGVLVVSSTSAPA